MWFFSCYEEYLWTVDSGFTQAKIFLENIRKLHKIHIKKPTVKFTLWVYTSQRFLGKVEKFLGKVENWIKFASKYQWQSLHYVKLQLFDSLFNATRLHRKCSRKNPLKFQQAIASILKIWFCVKSVQIRRYFWFVFSCIRTEYGDLSYFWSVFSCIQTDLLRKSPYSIRMQENMDQK